MVILDTNVISELVKAAPNPAVVAHILGLAADTIFTAAVCEAEIRCGLARMPGGHNRDTLIGRITLMFDTGLKDHVLGFDRACAAAYGTIRHAREAAGKPIQVQDAMIAATASAYGAVSDFENCGVTVVDPWVARSAGV